MSNIIKDTFRNMTRNDTSESGGDEFIDNVEAIRDRAQKRIEDGAVTDNYQADREAVVQLLNDALATELVCALRYKRHYFMASGLDAEPAAAEFLEHATEEMEHADMLAGRIVQLGGEPDFSPHNLVERSHSRYEPCSTLEEMLQENLVAERMAIDIYGQIIRFVGDDDPTTRRQLEEILAKEEEHADDLAGLLDDNGKLVNA
ncbi:MAG: ferritin-like domain-containing protein [Woeseiaceae bacterium]